MWDTVTHVTTGITLVAFLAAVALSAYRYSLKTRAKIIQSLPSRSRPEALSRELNAFGIDASHLSGEQQFMLALKEIELRRSRLYMFTFVVVGLAVISGSVAAYAMSVERPDPGRPPQQGAVSPSPQTAGQDTHGHTISSVTNNNNGPMSGSTFNGPTIVNPSPTGLVRQLGNRSLEGNNEWIFLAPAGAVVEAVGLNCSAFMVVGRNFYRIADNLKAPVPGYDGESVRVSIRLAGQPNASSGVVGSADACHGKFLVSAAGDQQLIDLNPSQPRGSVLKH